MPPLRERRAEIVALRERSCGPDLAGEIILAGRTGRRTHHAPFPLPDGRQPGKSPPLGFLLHAAMGGEIPTCPGRPVSRHVADGQGRAESSVHGLFQRVQPRTAPGPGIYPEGRPRPDRRRQERQSGRPDRFRRSAGKHPGRQDRDPCHVQAAQMARPGAAARPGRQIRRYRHPHGKIQAERGGSNQCPKENPWS